MAKGKNEAKIKFTAETGEFNKAIQKSNSEMSELRAEMKLNEAQMDNTGQSAEGLERKHELLKKQLDAAGDKTDALASKLKSAEKYFGSNSTEASKLRTQLSKAKTEQAKLEGAVRNCANELKDFDKKIDDAGDSARNAADGFTVAKGAISDFISDTMQAGIDKVGEFVDYIGGLPEETREARQGMSILNTSFDEAGLSAEQGKNLVRELYGVLGDNDRAVEAATLIAKMSDNQKDLNAWTEISTGIFGTYGESLPVESLVEAANETAKTGKVTGTFADALNWSSEAAEMFSQYMSEDVTTAEDAFNEALGKCTTEQERQSFITETLTALYGDAAGKYRESAGGMIEANKAAHDLAQTESEVGEKVEPVTTAWDGLKNQLLTAALPAIEKIADGLSKGLGWLQEHPTVLNAVATAFGIFAVGLGIAAGAWAVYTVFQLAANAAMLPVIGIAVGVIAVIALLVAAGVALYQNWDTIKAWALEKWAAIKEAVSTAVETAKTAVSNAWNAVKTATTNAFNAAKTTASNIWNGIKAALSNAVNGAKTAVSNAWNAVKTFTSNAFNAVKTTASNIWNGIKTTLSNAVNAAKTTVSNVWNGIKNTTSSVFNSVKSTVSSIWNGIKSAIQTPIESAKNKVKSVIDSIKGFFNFKFSWPHIPMPHFGISPAGWKVGDLLNGVIPKLGIEWYAKGGILTKPTVFGMNGNNAMIGGEAGPEAILPIDRLEGYIANAIEKRMNVTNLQALADAVEDLASRPIALNINGRQFALATASDGDSVNGLRSNFKSRGLALE